LAETLRILIFVMFNIIRESFAKLMILHLLFSLALVVIVSGEKKCTTKSRSDRWPNLKGGLRRQCRKAYSRVIFPGFVLGGS